MAWLKTFYEDKKSLFLTGGVILLVLAVYVVSVFLQPSVPPTPPPGAPPTITLEGSVWTGFGVPGSPVVARGDYAYAAPTEGDFQIFDIRDKQNPKIVGHVLVGFGNGVEVEGNYAYLKLLGSPPGGFVVVDISDPARPKLIKSSGAYGAYWHTPGDNKSYSDGDLTVGALRLKNGYAYITMYPSDLLQAEAEHDFVILDVRNPNTIREVSRMKVGTKGAFQLLLNDNLAYVGLVAGGVAIVDISNPQQPVLLATYRGEGTGAPPYLIGTAGQKLVMASWNSELIWYAYGSNQDKAPPTVSPAELIIVDVSDPRQPMKIGSYRFTEEKVFPWQGVTAGRYLYVLDHRCSECGLWPELPRTRILTFDIGDAAPKLLNEYVQREQVHMNYMSKEGSYLYVSEIGYGIRILSLADPVRPQLVGSAPTASEGRYAWANDEQTLGFVMESHAGTRIHIIDIADKSKPVKVGFYWDGNHIGWYTSPASKDSFLYVPGMKGTRGDVDIIDVSNPKQPMKTGTFLLEKSGAELQWPRIRVSGQYAYLTVIKKESPESESYEAALLIYDVSNPSRPVLKSRHLLVRGSGNPVYAPQLTLLGRYAYLVLGDARTLWIVDIENPKAPRTVGSITDPNRLRFPWAGNEGLTNYAEYGGRITVSQGYAYIVASEDFTEPGLGPDGKLQLLHIIDVRNPAKPVYVSAFEDYTGLDFLFQGDNFLNECIASGNLLYCSTYSRLLVFDISNSAKPRYLTDSQRAGIKSPFDYLGQVTGWSLGRLISKGGETRLYSPVIQGLNIIKVAP